jgi:hypothetical protein
MSKHVSQLVAAAVVVAFTLALGGSALAKSLDSPTITGITPTSALPGSTITINGTNLSGATVTFRKLHSSLPPVAATQAETTVTSDGTRILLTIPDGSDAANGMLAMAGKNQLLVTTPGGTAAAPFEVLGLRKVGMAPVISALRPLRAHPGSTVTIIGSHLSGTRAVWLAGRKAQFRVPSDSIILATVPMHARSGQWSVTTPVGTTASSLRFAVLPAL